MAALRLRIAAVIGAVWAIGHYSYQSGFCASDGLLGGDSTGTSDITVTVPMRLNLAVDPRARLVTLETNFAPDRARFSFSGSLGDPEVAVRSVPRGEQPARLGSAGNRARRWRGVFKVYGTALSGAPVAAVAMQSDRLRRETLTFMVEPT